MESGELEIEQGKMSRAEMGTNALREIIKRLESEPPTDRLSSAVQINTYNTMIQTMNNLWLQWNNIEAFHTFTLEELEVVRLVLLDIAKKYIDATQLSLQHLEDQLPEIPIPDLDSQMRVT